MEDGIGFTHRKKDSAIRQNKSNADVAKSTESAFWKSVFAGAGSIHGCNMELKCIGPDNEEDYITQNRMIEGGSGGWNRCDRIFGD